MACKVQTRYMIMAMIFLSTYINYTTRSNMSVSITAMVVRTGGSKPYCLMEQKDKKNVTPVDTGPKYVWNENEQGLILAAYFYGYTVGCLPSGFVAEWIGPFNTIFYTTLAAGVLNSAGAFLAPFHYLYLFFMRFLIGFTGGLVYPALQCLIGRWAPPQERAKFVACLMGNTLGTCLTWIIVGDVTQRHQWPWGFHILGLQIVGFLIIFFIFTADSPEQHKWIREEELTYIKESQQGAVSKTKAVAPVFKILTSFPFWTLVILHFGNLYGLYIQITYVPKFMKEVIGFNIRESGFLSSLPHLVRLVLGLFYGWMGDFLKKKKFKRVLILKSFILLSHIIPGILMGCMGLVKCNADAALTLLVLSMSLNGAVVITNLSNPTDLSPNFAGSIFGYMSLIGGMSGFIGPSVNAFVIDKMGNNITAYSIIFAIGGILYCGCGVFFIFFGTADTQPWNEKKEDTEAAQKST